MNLFKACSSPLLSTEAVQRVTDSVDFLSQELKAGSIIYGVNTFFGGSAEPRTPRLRPELGADQQHNSSAAESVPGRSERLEVYYAGFKQLRTGK